MGILEQEGYASIRRKAQKYVRDMVTEAVNRINTHTTVELEKHMATILEAIDRLAVAIATEIQQVRDELQGAIDSLSEENAELAALLQAQVDTLASAQTRVETIASELEANDPPVEPPVEG